MNTGSMIAGRALIGWMVWTVPGAPAMVNRMVSRPGSPAAASPEAALVLAAVSASRRVTKPSIAMLSSTLVTVMTAGTERSSSASTSGRRLGGRGAGAGRAGRKGRWNQRHRKERLMALLPERWLLSRGRQPPGPKLDGAQR